MMAKEKQYKCSYAHCKRKEERLSVDSPILNGRHYHSECLKEKESIEKIRNLYIEQVSQTVVMSLLNKTINNIIFQKKVSADFLYFALNWAIKNHKRINSPLYLHYLIDNKAIKDAYTANISKSVYQQTKTINTVSDTVFNIKPVKPKKSFNDILKGK